MVNVLRGGLRPGAFILSESEASRSRDNLTIASGRTVKPGEICGIVAIGGKVKVLDAVVVTGEDDAAAIPIYGYDATSADTMGAFITRDAEVIEDALIWPAGITGPEKILAISQLAARGIIIRPRSYVG